jgi:hypothetical protein
VIYYGEKRTKIQYLFSRVEIGSDEDERRRLHSSQITETLGITDKDRVKEWWRKYKEEGKVAFIDK